MRTYLPRSVLLLVLLALPAGAHVGDLFGGMDLIVPATGTELGIDASFGLLWSTDGDRFEWICHEAILAEEAYTNPTYAHSGDGVFLGIVPSEDVAREPGRAVYRSTDGCDWQAVDGLEGQRITGLVFAPADASVALASTGNLDAANALYRSADGGASFQATEVVADDGWVFRSVMVSASGSAWATSTQASPNAGRIHFAADGSSWTAVDVPLEPVEERITQLAVLAVSPTNPDEAWFVQGPLGGPDVVLHTTDGGETLTSLYESYLNIIDGALDDTGALWIVRLDNSLYRSVDGGAFEPVDGAPTVAGIDAGRGAIHAVTKDSLRSGELAVTENEGKTWSSRPVLDIIDGPRDCPAETHMGAICPGLWEEALDRLVAEPDDTGEPGDTDDYDAGPECGCSTSAGGWWMLGIAAMLAVRRRK